MKPASPEILESVRVWRAGGFTSWQGTSCWQFQADLDRYWELIQELRPPFVIEIGAADGGTAVFLADALKEASHEGIVISIDIQRPRVASERIAFLLGDSINPNLVEVVARLTNGQRGLVLIDGDHSSAHVARELDLYAEHADYLVVQDTIMEWLAEYNDGPLDALAPWLLKHPEFQPDPDPRPTQHPGGYLRRIER